MRMMHLAAAMALVLAAAAGLRAVDGPARGQALAAPAVDERDVYRLSVNGSEAGCLLSAGRWIDSESRAIDLSERCVFIDHPLALARVWIERPHGDVALADDAGRVLIEFGASDGAAFESFKPTEPLMTLTALR